MINTPTGLMLVGVFYCADLNCYKKASSTLLGYQPKKMSYACSTCIIKATIPFRNKARRMRSIFHTALVKSFVVVFYSYTLLFRSIRSCSILITSISSAEIK